MNEMGWSIQQIEEVTKELSLEPSLAIDEMTSEMASKMEPLVPEIVPPPQDYSVIHIPLNELLINHEWNCRGKVTPYDVQDLMSSIAERGLDSPVIVRKLEGQEPFRYELIAGFRRTTAFTALHKEHPENARFLSIPAKVVQMQDEEADVLNLVENIQRDDLSLYQEARGLGKIAKHGYTPEYIARKIGKPVRWVRSRLLILDMPEDIQETIDKGILNIKQVERIHVLPTEKRYAYIRQVKEQLQTLDKLETPDRKKPSPGECVARSRADINRMLSWIYENVGANFATRVLAWTVGNIPTSELVIDLQTEVKLAKGDHALIGLDMPDV